MLDVNAIKTPEDFVRVVFDELTTLQDLNYIDDIEKYEEEIKTFENQLKNARLSLINENYTHKIIADKCRLLAQEISIKSLFSEEGSEIIKWACMAWLKIILLDQAYRITEGKDLSIKNQFDENWQYVFVVLNTRAITLEQAKNVNNYLYSLFIFRIMVLMPLPTEDDYDMREKRDELYLSLSNNCIHIMHQLDEINAGKTRLNYASSALFYAEKTTHVEPDKYDRRYVVAMSAYAAELGKTKPEEFNNAYALFQKALKINDILEANTQKDESLNITRRAKQKFASFLCNAMRQKIYDGRVGDIGYQCYFDYLNEAKKIAESLYYNDQYYKTPQGNEDRAYDYYLLCEINWQLSLFCHKYYPSEVFEKDNTLNKCYYFVSNIELYKQGKFTDPMVALFAGYELLKFLYDSRCYVHAIEYLKDIDELLSSRQFKQSDITKPKTNELISTMTTYYSKLKTEFKNSRNEYTNIMEPYIDSGLAILQTKRIY